MKTIFNAFPGISILIFVISVSSVAKDSRPNTPSAAEKIQSETQRKPIADIPSNSGAIRSAKAELRAEIYKESVGSLKWALGIIIGFVVIFVGYAVFKDTREYRQAVADAKQALSEARNATKEARDASDRARECEEKAQERLASIDEEVALKLKGIEEKGKASVNLLIQEGKEQRQVSQEEAKKQRRITELWRKGGNAYDSKKYKLAVDYYLQILEQDPDDVETLNNCGIALSSQAENMVGAEADKLFHEAYDNFEKAVSLKHDFHVALYNWSDALLCQSRMKTGKERRQLLEKAKDKCLKAESIEPGAGAYNLACVCALLGEITECKKWFKVGEQAGTLETREYAIKDWPLKSVHDKAWFKKIRWKGE